MTPEQLLTLRQSFKKLIEENNIEGKIMSDYEDFCVTFYVNKQEICSLSETGSWQFNLPQ
jgi:hypothetical protein